ncbi:serine-threonine protein kinase, putative [Perkinsus marinus ATCC 50983]|uniref:Serine-threonine protein kinase, putative n=1 Tax=Perkinsus marinus (strain ATCC 50983 / TXsc) TaxID=423536 RepID=C5KNZ5_PERM5|nr:serine-threonine protein kinase, putative [Perkinsus marinus ATCC 50983]EER13783.1 serine-threonine protein kinase, putative [Perkinsus marinus ATCC 50983]|eukprot:XP_002781988.1 serine-threonine protein kinase, putative [Perkinsus marinus ATCC 50983]
MPVGRQVDRVAQPTVKKRRKSTHEERDVMEELIGRKLMMRRGNGLHNGFIRGVVIYERERLLDVIWDDGDIEFMPDYIARGNLLPGSPSEGSPAADTEGQPTTAGGKSTRTTSTGVNKIQVESKHESVDLAPKHSSARSGDGTASSTLQPSTTSKSAGTGGRMVVVKTRHKGRKATAASECLLPELYITRETRELTNGPPHIHEGQRSWLSDDEDTILALRRIVQDSSLDHPELWSAVLRGLLRLALASHEMTYEEYSCIRRLQDIMSMSPTEELLNTSTELLTSVQYLCTIAIDVAALTSASVKFSLYDELGYGDYLLDGLPRDGDKGATLWFDGPQGFTTQEVCRAFEQKLGADHEEDDDAVLSPTSRPGGPDLILGRVLEGLPVDETFKPLPTLSSSPTKLEDPSGPSQYTLVVDSCQDATLRRYIRRSHDFMPSIEGHTIEHSIGELQKFVKRKTAPRRYTDTGPSVDPEAYLRDIAITNGGIVNISSVTAGCTSRPQAVLFKALCDANGIACRLIRQDGGLYYNSILIRDRSYYSDALSDDGDDQDSEDGVSQDGQSLIVNDDDDDEEDEDDSDFEGSSSSDKSQADGDESATHKVLETVLPIFWDPSVGDTPSSTPSSPETSPDILEGVRDACQHPLDRLIIEAGKATSKRSIDLDKHFEFITRIGRGSFGEVWRVKLIPNPEDYSECGALLAHPSSSGEYALKMVPEAHIDEEEGELMRTYCSAGHPCITEVLAIFYAHQRLPSRRKGSHHIERSWCCLMTVEDTSLEVLLDSRDKYVRRRLAASPAEICPNEEASFDDVPVLLDLRFTFRLLIDTAFAMMFLHTTTNNRTYVLHRDLKPANILLTKLNANESILYRARLTDFGVARANPGQDTNMTIGLGTEGYIAPEQHSIEYDRPADVWSFGVTVARICGLDSWKDVAAVSTRPTTTNQQHNPSRLAEPVVKFPPTADSFLKKGASGSDITHLIEE